MASSSSASIPSSFIEYYSIKPDYASKHKCLIFDIRKFDEGLNVDNRDEDKADIDLANFVKTFRELDFDVEVNANKTRNQIGQKIIDIKISLDVDAKCIAIAVLSKGHQDYFLASDGLFKIDWIWTPLMPIKPDDALIGQPKLFIFQVEEIILNTGIQTDAPEANKDFTPPSLPAPQSDMFYIHLRIPAKVEFPNYDWSFSNAMRKTFTPDQAKKDHIGKLITKVNYEMTTVYREAEKKKVMKDKLAELVNGELEANKSAIKAATDVVIKEQQAIEAERKAEEAKVELAKLEQEKLEIAKLENVKSDEKKKLNKENKEKRENSRREATRNENEGKKLRDEVEKSRELLTKSVEKIKSNCEEAVKVAVEYVEETKREVERREKAISIAKEKLDDANKMDQRTTTEKNYAKLQVSAAQAEIADATKALAEAEQEVLVAIQEVERYKNEVVQKASVSKEGYLATAKAEEDKNVKQTEATTTRNDEGTATTNNAGEVDGSQQTSADAEPMEVVKEQEENQIKLRNKPSKPMVATTVSHLRKLFFLKMDN